MDRGKEGKMDSEVRFYHMIPDQIVKRRTKCPIAYLPVGALEWHGSHLPFGTDCKTADYFAIMGAKKYGGVAFPVITYNDIRYNLVDAFAQPQYHDAYCKEMQLSSDMASTFVNGEKQPGHYKKSKKKNFIPLPMSYQEQVDFFAKSVAYAIMEIYLYGFKGIIVVPGHGGIAGFCDRGIEMFLENSKCSKNLQPAPIVRNYFYLNSCRDSEPYLKKASAHADKWETAILKTIEPESVHLEKISANPKKVPNAYMGLPIVNPETGQVQGKKHPCDKFAESDPRSTPEDREYGQLQIDTALKGLKKVVEDIKQLLKKKDR